MAGEEPPEIMSASIRLDLMSDMTQTPKQMSTNDMTMLLSDNSQDLQSLNNIGANLSSATASVLSTVSAAASTIIQTNNHNGNSQNLAPQHFQSSTSGVVPQTLIVSSQQGQQQVLSAVSSSQTSLLNSTGKRVILQPANASMNSLVQNIVQQQGYMQGVKRGAPGQQVVTKFIIQKNPSGGQQPIMVSQSSSSSHVTFSQSGIMSSSDTLTAAQQQNTKVAIAAAKSPASKIRMVPASSVSGKSPQKIIPVTIPRNAIITGAGHTIQLSGHSLTQMASDDGKTLTLSPSKIIVRQPSFSVHGKQQIQPVQLINANSKSVAVPISSTAISLSNLQPIQVSGSRFNYVRLVNPTQSSATQGVQPVSLVQSIAKPIVTNDSNNSTQQVKIQLPANYVQQPQQIITKQVGGQTTLQRVILPTSGSLIRAQGLAQNQPSIPPAVPNTLGRPKLRPAVANISQASTVQLPDNTSLLNSICASTDATCATSTSGGSNIPPGFTLVPAQYLSNLANIQPIQSKPLKKEYVPIASNSVDASDLTAEYLNANGSGITEAPGTRPRKPCNCTKSQCLKLYCDCFANGEFCNGCNCNNCYNNLKHEDERSKAIRSCLDRNPHAFHPKIGKAAGMRGEGETDRRHTKGCNCKKSGCLKNYCECYEAKISCSDMCRCVGCKNFDDSPERRSLLELADAAESRVLQIGVPKPRINDSKAYNSRLPYTFITTEVGEATCACLLAQAEDSERERHSLAMEERLIFQEFGRCLLQIIESANRTKSLQDSMG